MLFKLVSKTSVILCSLSCYESPRMFGDAAEGGLVIIKFFKRYFFICSFCQFFLKELKNSLSV